eukprot:GHVR01068430.1.p1 GENE.GHVR01068430.1~~GHVR01068430.1.p1  ORF type:complete len:162 (+),score=50.06 GHVR01068430.1:64-549(+)
MTHTHTHPHYKSDVGVHVYFGKDPDQWLVDNDRDPTHVYAWKPGDSEYPTSGGWYELVGRTLENGTHTTNFKHVDVQISCDGVRETDKLSQSISDDEDVERLKRVVVIIVFISVAITIVVCIVCLVLWSKKTSTATSGGGGGGLGSSHSKSDSKRNSYTPV